jgi:2,4-dienoyl-CoA reductase-like NADH-dependent reductase (Old Yellow Enzyme family)/thioredoxin reductase
MMSKYRHVFQPLKIGHMVARNRIEVSPGANLLGSEEGFVTRELIEWTRRMARGGAGVVTVGMSFVNPMEQALRGFSLDLSSDKVVNGLSRLVESIHRYGARASIELAYMEFVPPQKPQEELTEENLARIRNETSINDKVQVRLPAELSQADIERIIDCFASAAERCLRAGMDMVLIHGAHEMLISQFLSPHKNKRTDKYGGSIENRSRFVNEMLEAIRERVGRELAIEYRLSAEELTPDGIKLEDSLAFAKLIQDKIDLLHVSAGTLSDDQIMGCVIQPTYYERGYNVHYAAAFKEQLQIPVTTVGSINLDLAEEILAAGRADMVAMLRTIIADPDAVKKAQQGAAATIRPCVRCNTCINRPHYFFLPVRCAVNPLAGREVDFMHEPPSPRQKKVVVIGGGPAGMEAARTAADRGHEVILFEKEPRLGGTLNKAAAPPFKADMKTYLDWAVQMTTSHPRIKVRLATAATPELIKAEQPDALVIAVGARPNKPDIPGINRDHVVWVGDLEPGRVRLGENIIVAGGGMTGCETALQLALQGKKVTVVEMLTLEEIVTSAPIINMLSLLSLLKKNGVRLLTETKLDSITATGALVIDAQGQKQELAGDTVILSLGVIPDREAAARFDGLAAETYVIGDCAVSRGSIWTATTTAFDAAMEI